LTSQALRHGSAIRIPDLALAKTADQFGIAAATPASGIAAGGGAFNQRP
jgi:hypothetical protein